MSGNWFARAGRRIASLLRRSRRERDLDEEMRFHLEMEATQYEAAGLSPAEARRRAHAEFGGIERVKEECREARGIRLLEDLVQDLRYGVRTLRRTPAFTVVALVGLAIGIGGPAAILGSVHGLLLKPLPYADDQRLVFAFQHDRRAGNERQEVSPANFFDWRERVQSFETLAALEPYGLDWLSETGPVYLETWLVTEGFFDMLGVRPLAGRTFRPDEHQSGRGNVVVLGYGAWQRRFGGDPAVVGRTVTMDGEPYEIIGIMPGAFALPGKDLIWAPKVLQGWERQSRATAFYTVVGRLGDSVSLGQAQADLDRVASQLSHEYPDTNTDSGIRLVSLADHIRGKLRPMMMLLLGAVLFVFLIACANLANLQIARSLKRTHEFALRGALGAGPARVVRQLVTESLLLAGAGCVLGYLLSHYALVAIQAWAPPELTNLHELRADVWVLVYAMVTALVAAAITGLLPARVAVRTDLRTRLSEGGRSMTVGRGPRRVRDALVVAQVAFSLVLLVGAGLLLRSFAALLNEDRGFRTQDVSVLTVHTYGYVATQDRVSFVEDATSRIAELPSVRSVAVATSIPIAPSIGAEKATFAIVGQPVSEGAEAAAIVTVVTPDYFRTLGVPLRRGRFLEAGDRADALRVAVINETMARRYWPSGEVPMGERIRMTFGQTAEWTVVGVVGDVRRRALHEQPSPAIYIPFAQSPGGANAFFIWSEGDSGVVMSAAKNVLWELQPTMPLSREATMATIVGDSLRDRRFLLVLLGLFAGSALALAAIGIFGVVSYGAAERTREIGVRMAFGACPGDVARLVVRHGGGLALAGVFIGLASSALLTHLLAGMLYSVRALDVFTFAAASVALLGVALIASWAPASQAARLDPMAALRVE